MPGSVFRPRPGSPAPFRRLSAGSSGGDFDALDALRLLYAPPSAAGRNETKVASPPAFNASISGDVYVTAGAEIRLVAPPSATLDLRGRLELSGGCLSGRGRTVVRGSTLMASPAAKGSANTHGEPSACLRNGLSLDMLGGGRWSGGDVVMTDGAKVVNRALFEVLPEGFAFGAGTCPRVELPRSRYPFAPPRNPISQPGRSTDSGRHHRIASGPHAGL